MRIQLFITPVLISNQFDYFMKYKPWSFNDKKWTNCTTLLQMTYRKNKLHVCHMIRLVARLQNEIEDLTINLI